MPLPERKVFMLYKSRCGRYWVEKAKDGYRMKLGHVTCILPYHNDTEAITAVKRARAQNYRNRTRC